MKRKRRHVTGMLAESRGCRSKQGSIRLCRSLHPSGATAASRHVTSRCNAANVSASAAGLSVLIRAMRGKRIATPDLCRLEA